MADEKPNREAMYRVFRSLWYTKEEDKDIETYEFNITPFWLRVYNIPLEYTDRQTTMDVEKATGELVAIDWKDRNGGWTEFIRLKDSEARGKRMGEIIYTLKYERLSNFCYFWGRLDIPLKDAITKLEALNQEGGRRKLKVQIEDFREVLEELTLVDIKPTRDAIVIRQTKSDHDTVLLDTLGKKLKEKCRDPRLAFRYDVCWAKDKRAKEIIKDRWCRRDENTLGKIDGMRKVLRPWPFKKYNKMKAQISVLAKHIDRIIDGPTILFDMNNLREARLELGNLYSEEESYWV
ncbi:hypothetical protein GOBAR_AA10865 [Gossypium barbadense]|uniref:Uncharacterized protein n=1 Tax=Gossypium barbadense TaxID=3634 RepID=A0A2P5Y2E2_GOSBA|nr:hypothetical protein GOBAR_AA10865 [Gossypium barbadense]